MYRGKGRLRSWAKQVTVDDGRIVSVTLSDAFPALLPVRPPKPVESGKGRDSNPRFTPGDVHMRPPIARSPHAAAPADR